MKRRTFKSNQRRRQNNLLNRKINTRSRVYFRVVLANAIEQGLATEFQPKTS